jgi:hypothetical protein
MLLLCVALAPGSRSPTPIVHPNAKETASAFVFPQQHSSDCEFTATDLFASQIGYQER